MKNSNLNTVLTSVVLIFKCADPRITPQVLLSIIEEVNQALGCFKLHDYKLGAHGTVTQFYLSLSYPDKVDMLNRFAWLMLQIAQDGYVFYLEKANFEEPIAINNSIVQNPIVGNNNAVAIANSTFKVKRKHWNY